jgi:hypothetical protein
MQNRLTTLRVSFLDELPFRYSGTKNAACRYGMTTILRMQIDVLGCGKRMRKRYEA